MYRFASNGEMGEPCGMPRRLFRASVVRVFLPRSSVSSTGQSSHILIRCSTRRSTIRRVTDFRSSACGSPRGRRQRLPGGHGLAALPPRPPPVAHCAQDGRHTVLVGGRLQRSVPEGRTGTRMIRVGTSAESTVGTVSIVGATRGNGSEAIKPSLLGSENKIQLCRRCRRC